MTDDQLRAADNDAYHSDMDAADALLARWDEKETNGG